MDETKETRQDNPSAETPEGDKGTTPETTPETLAEQVAHVKEAALAEVGRYRVASEAATKAAETANKAAKGAEDRLNKYIKQQEEEAEDKYRDEPEQLTKIRQQRKDRAREAELEERERKLGEREEGVTESEKKTAVSTQEISTREIATRLNVDFALLAKLAKLTDYSKEAIEAEAQTLPKVGEAKPVLLSDSSKTIGGSQEPNTAKGKMRAGWDELHK